MTFQIFDTGASIKILSDWDIKMVMKSAIISVSVIKGDIIKIETANPLEAIYIRHRDVSIPATASPIILRDTLNTMVSNCLCCDANTGSNESHE